MSYIGTCKYLRESKTIIENTNKGSAWVTIFETRITNLSWHCPFEANTVSLMVTYLFIFYICFYFFNGYVFVRLYLMKEMYNNYDEEEEDWDKPEVGKIPFQID